jgi:hypothetical protein
MLILSPVQGVTEFVITNQQITFLIRKYQDIIIHLNQVK